MEHENTEVFPWKLFWFLMMVVCAITALLETRHLEPHQTLGLGIIFGFSIANYMSYMFDGGGKNEA